MGPSQQNQLLCRVWVHESLNDCLYKYSYEGRLYIEKKQYLSRLLYELHIIL